ncbi:9484_t:CDS:2 [Funneliformis mosseae]|uniref:9484_t:CDS:1 n=1 Tax=Funneliformis mosseae TaxID=27381 RepID=A0A9N8WLL1_FUNMO|nr:9484_t:CDS:2 [Funneliformis mosseae]
MHYLHPLPISILPDDSEEKRKYIIRLILEQFPSPYLSDSSERSERFDLNSLTLCSLCNGDHKEESLWNNIRDEWGDSDYCRE